MRHACRGRRIIDGRMADHALPPVVEGLVPQLQHPVPTVICGAAQSLRLSRVPGPPTPGQARQGAGTEKAPGPFLCADPGREDLPKIPVGRLPAHIRGVLDQKHPPQAGMLFRRNIPPFPILGGLSRQKDAVVDRVPGRRGEGLLPVQALPGQFPPAAHGTQPVGIAVLLSPRPRRKGRGPKALEPGQPGPVPADDLRCVGLVVPLFAGRQPVIVQIVQHNAFDHKTASPSARCMQTARKIRSPSPEPKNAVPAEGRDRVRIFGGKARFPGTTFTPQPWARCRHTGRSGHRLPSCRLPTGSSPGRLRRRESCTASCPAPRAPRRAWRGRR